MSTLFEDFDVDGFGLDDDADPVLNALFGVDAARAAARLVAEPSSEPVYTERCGDLLVMVVAVNCGGRNGFQVYAVEGDEWSLVGLFGLLCDALGEVNTWRRFIATGGTLRQWSEMHPHGVQVGGNRPAVTR